MYRKQKEQCALCRHDCHRGLYCIFHKCVFSLCERQRAGKYFCKSHKCKQKECEFFKIGIYKFCTKHLVLMS